MSIFLRWLLNQINIGNTGDEKSFMLGDILMVSGGEADRAVISQRFPGTLSRYCREERHELCVSPGEIVDQNP
jgi:hypothetical protein